MSILCTLPKPFPIKIKVSCLAVIALTMWLGGFGCALCCATGVTASCRLDQRNPSPDYGAKSCCSQAESDCASGTEEAISQRPGAMGCSLLPDQSRSLAPLPRVNNDLHDGFETINPLSAVIGYTGVATTIDPASPRNRGGPYLRCCVLLI